jgi:hypothetical protein
MSGKLTQNDIVSPQCLPALPDRPRRSRALVQQLVRSRRDDRRQLTIVGLVECRCGGSFHSAFAHCCDCDCVSHRCIEVDRSQIMYMGYSLRVHGWRYTAWQPWNGTTLSAVAWPEDKPSNGSSIVDGSSSTSPSESSSAASSLLFFEVRMQSGRHP